MNYDERLKAERIAEALSKAMDTAMNGKPISQAELSRKSGVPQPTISRTLSGKSIPETSTLINLSAVLGLKWLEEIGISHLLLQEPQALVITKPLTSVSPHVPAISRGRRNGGLTITEKSEITLIEGFRLAHPDIQQSMLDLARRAIKTDKTGTNDPLPND